RCSTALLDYLPLPYTPLFRSSPRAIQIRQAVLAFGQTADGIAGAVPTDLAGKFSKGRLRFAQGGFVPGKGGPTQDNIHAMLSAGDRKSTRLNSSHVSNSYAAI